mgnify:CR=1 FL=1
MDKELKHIIRLLYGIIILAVVIIVLLGLPQTNKPNIPKEEQIPLASIGFDKEDTLNQYDVAALNLAFFTPHAPLFLAEHCLGSQEGIDVSEKTIREIFRKKYYPHNMQGYHYVVGLKGNIIELVPIDASPYLEPREIVWGVANQNSHTISIAYVGGVDKKLKAKDTRTPEQKVAMNKLKLRFKTQFPNIRIQGHRDFSGVFKECPSYDAIDTPYNCL